MDYYAKQAADRLAESCGTDRNAVMLLAQLTIRHLPSGVSDITDSELSGAIQRAQADLQNLSSEVLDALAENRRQNITERIVRSPQAERGADFLEIMLRQVREGVCND